MIQSCKTVTTNLPFILLIFLFLAPYSHAFLYVPCDTDADCSNNYYCSQQHYCVYNGIFSNPTAAIIGIFLAFLGLTIGNAAGIGGAPFLIPIFILIFQMNQADAVALSPPSFFWGICFNVLLKLKTKHPLYNKRPVIDYGLVGILMPSLQLGSNLGIMMARTFSNSCSMLLFLLFLIASIITIGKKANEVYRAENVELLKAQHQRELTEILHTNKHEAETVPALKAEIFEILDNERGYISKNVVIMCSIIFVGFIVVLIQGGQTNPSLIGIEYCGGAFWMLNFMFLIFCAGMQYIAIKNNKFGMVLYELDHPENANLTKEEILAKQSNELFKLIIAGVIAGVFSSLMGVGGGVIINPILIGLKIHPAVVNACSLVVIILTSLTTSLQYLIYGKFRVYPDAVVFGLVSIISGYVGNKIYEYIKNKYKRNSYLIFVVVFSFAFAFIVLSLYFIYHLTIYGSNAFRIASPCKLLYQSNIVKVVGK